MLKILIEKLCLKKICDIFVESFRMAKLDTYHNDVIVALQKDGWTITHDQMTINWEDDRYYPDLGAERVIAATKGLEKIAVEIKSFSSGSLNSDFYEALGQYDTYTMALKELEPERKVVLAVSMDTFNTFFKRKSVLKIIEIKKLRILVYNFIDQTVEKWIN